MHKKDKLLLNDYYSTYAPQGNVYNGEEGDIPFYEGQSLSFFCEDSYIIMCFSFPPPPQFPPALFF